MPTDATPHQQFRLKNLPRTAALLLLTVGASLILGFLSFSGMFAMIPVVSLAVAAFVLSVAYEGEIYLQNIKGAFKKLFQFNYSENKVAADVLNELSNAPFDSEPPQFFKDCLKNQTIIKELNEKITSPLDPEEKKRVQQERKHRLKYQKNMTKWFAKQLFNQDSKIASSHYAEELRQWLQKNEETLSHRQQLTQHQRNKTGVILFSLTASIFMTLGSTYLIGEALSVIPWVAALSPAVLPFVILSMSIIAGAAYGFLIFNTVTDFMADGFLNNTLVKWYRTLRDDLKNNLTMGNMAMVTLAVMLILLAGALTVCTAGTWLSIAKESRPLFAWMSKMPTFIMTRITPLITGLAAIFFNLENTAESLEQLYDIRTTIQTAWKAIKENFRTTLSQENWFQRLNPLRILVKATVTPLRFGLFLGHLFSVALTADRMPGLPKTISQLIALISEGFEDAHYFIGDFSEEDAEHGHEQDIPTRMLHVIATPLYAAAALWDMIFSRLNEEERQLEFKQAWRKQRGHAPQEDNRLPVNVDAPLDWQREWVISNLENNHRRLSQSLGAAHIIEEKCQALQEGIEQIKQAKSAETIKTMVLNMSQDRVFQQQRFSLFTSTQSQTTENLTVLHEKISFF